MFNTDASNNNDMIINRSLVSTRIDHLFFVVYLETLSLVAFAFSWTPYGAHSPTSIIACTRSHSSCVNDVRMYIEQSLSFFLARSFTRSQYLCVRACFELFNSLNKWRSKGLRRNEWYIHLLPPDALRSIENVSIACSSFSIDRLFRNYKQSCQPLIIIHIIIIIADQ